jgi:hypothetical protein
MLARDTELHVVLLPAGPQHDFVMLGGGGAVIWRLLEGPLTARQIAERFDRASAPDEEELLGCLNDLVARGVLDLEESS